MAKAVSAIVKQEALPGMEQRDIEELVQAASQLDNTRKEIKLLKTRADQEEAAAIKIMIQHNKKVYRYRGVRLDIRERTKVSLRVKINDETVDAKARTRNTKVLIDELQKVVKPPAPEPTKEESQSNVAQFFDKKDSRQPGHQTADEALEATKTDDFTAPKCEECGRIDGGHTVSCSKASGLTLADYLSYALAKHVKNPNSWAKKWQLTREKDELVLAWKAEGETKAATRIAKSKPKPKAAAKPARRRARQ